MATTGRKPNWGVKGKYLIEKREHPRYLDYPWFVWGPIDQMPSLRAATFAEAVARFISETRPR